MRIAQEKDWSLHCLLLDWWTGINTKPAKRMAISLRTSSHPTFQISGTCHSLTQVTHPCPSSCHHQNSIVIAQNMHTPSGQRLFSHEVPHLWRSVCLVNIYWKKQLNASGSTIRQICEFGPITQILFSPFMMGVETAPVSLGCPKKMCVEWLDTLQSTQ